MLLATNKSIEDKIIELLSKKPLSSRDIWYIINSRSPVTVQGLYKSIRNLIKDGVIVKARGIVSINQEWIEKVNNLLNTKSFDLKLNEQESITYKFKSLSDLDTYWKHTVKNYIKDLSGPIFHCEPHEIWIHIEDRFESQIKYLNQFKENKRFGFLIFGSDTYMDKEYRNSYQNEYLRFDLNKNVPLIKRNQYITVIDNIIITTILDESTSKKIDDLYACTKSNDINFKNKLQNILENSRSVKLRIEKNIEKAKKIRKQLSKNFNISKKLVEEFNLF